VCSEEKKMVSNETEGIKPWYGMTLSRSFVFMVVVVVLVDRQPSADRRMAGAGDGQVQAMGDDGSLWYSRV
jgi:hypothetical protein